jgi:hypothetical protein
MDSELLARYLSTEHATPLVRTDFTDDAAWQNVVDELTKEIDVDGTPYSAHIELVDDRAFEGLTAAGLAEAAAGKNFWYVLLADHRSMREAALGSELTVVYVDLSVEPEDAEEFGDVYGRAFRCEAREVVTSVWVNLSIANVDFADFADAVDEDGVYRGSGD